MTEQSPPRRRKRHTTATDPRLSQAVLKQLAEAQKSQVDKPPAREDPPAEEAEDKPA